MKTKIISKITSILLSVIMFQSIEANLLTSVSAEIINLNNKQINNTNVNILDEDLNLDNLPIDLKTILNQESQNALKLDNETYSDVFSLGTINNDGTKSLLTFNHPIKYYDEKTNSFLFIDNKLSKVTNGNDVLYVNSGNSYHINMPEKITNGIELSNGKYSINMKPVSDTENDKTTLINNELRYEKVFDDYTNVSYELENSGIKESIVVSEPNGISTYDFVLSSNDLIPNETSGTSITFVDKLSGEPVYIIQPTYIVDSYNGPYIDDEKHITYNNYYDIEKLSDNSFLIHMNLDINFLNAESTVYPCIIDPSIWAVIITTDSSSYVQQSGGTGYINSQLSAGSFNGTGEHLSYVKAESVNKLKWIEPSQLQYASFNVKASSTGYSNNCTINLFDSTTTSNVSAVTYSELISSLGTLQDSTTFTTLGANYSFNITSLYRQWITYELGEGGKDPAYGFILRGAPNSSTPGRWFSSTSSSDTYFYLQYQESEEIEDGFYNIKNVSTGTYLRDNNGQIDLSSSPNVSTCKWQLILSKSADGTTTYGVYSISPYNNLNISMKGQTTGEYVTTNTYGNKFRIIRNADETFRIMPTNYASVSNAIGVNSNYAQIQEYSNISSMKWTFEPVSNEYFSKYTPDNINDVSGSSPTQYRLNCYGYAFCHILKYDLYDDYYALTGDIYYKQQPGDFTATSQKNLVKPIPVYRDPEEYMSRVVYNITLDAARLNINLTEYVPSGSTVKQCGANSRLIAIATGDYDYHFYMQHNDGTWSHKPGAGEVTNQSFDSTPSTPEYLNNDNIIQCANQSIYSNGELKFFEISRNAILDHPHGIQNAYIECDVFDGYDIAGDLLFTSKTINVGTSQALIDYYVDKDFYEFTPSISRTYYLSTSCQQNYDLDGVIYDTNGNIIQTINNIGQINTSFYAYSGKRYFIMILNYDNLPGDYTITIS